ncbi:hypothetical protein GCM10026982_55090 [Nocardiopsis aegyptia]
MVQLVQRAVELAERAWGEVGVLPGPGHASPSGRCLLLSETVRHPVSKGLAVWGTVNDWPLLDAAVLACPYGLGAGGS